MSIPIGLAGGVLTSYGQTVLRDGWAALANSAAPWVMVAFAIGLFLPGRWRAAAVAGLLSQVGLVLGYYVTSELRGFGAAISSIVIWSAAGAVAGPVYGAAASLLRHGLSASTEPEATETNRWPVLIRSAAAGVTGSVWIMESLRFVQLDADSGTGPGLGAAWGYALVGLLLPPLLARSIRERLYALGVLVLAAALAWAATLVIEAAFFL